MDQRNLCLMICKTEVNQYRIVVLNYKQNVGDSINWIRRIWSWQLFKNVSFRIKYVIIISKRKNCFLPYVLYFAWILSPTVFRFSLFTYFNRTCYSILLSSSSIRICITKQTYFLFTVLALCFYIPTSRDSFTRRGTIFLMDHYCD